MRQRELLRQATGVPVHVGALAGIRRADFEASHLEQAIAAHDLSTTETLKDDARSRVTAVPAGEARVIVKEVKKGGVRRHVADRFRGSPARRGFRAGVLLRSAGIGAALPLAFLEHTRAGIPVRSLLVSRDLRPFPTAAELATTEPEGAVRLLCDLVIRLHEGGFVHGDLRAQHVHLCGPESHPALIDLEGVHLERRLRDEQRMEALAQLNASLPDNVVSNEQRVGAFERYVRALPFSAPDARDRIAQMSRARQHLWRGTRAC